MKTALVTGTSSGFGRGTVTAFLERGYRVFATLRNASERPEVFADEQNTYGDRLVVLSLDVARDDERAAVVAAVRDASSGTNGSRGSATLDCLVNNAGYALFGALEDTTDAQLRAQLDVNLVGAMLLTRDRLPALRATRGAVVNVSSVFGYSGFPLTSVYCASKFGLEGFSEALYHELKPHGVRVHLVEPGGHRTGFSKNVVWAEGRAEGGATARSDAFAAATRGYHAFKARLEKKGGPPADRVPRKIVDLADRPSSALRVPIGVDARALAWLNLLPSALMLPAWSGALQKMLRAEPVTS